MSHGLDSEPGFGGYSDDDLEPWKKPKKEIPTATAEVMQTYPDFHHEWDNPECTCAYCKGVEDQQQNENKKEHFTTGSQRDSREGKGRFDLIPAHTVRELAKHYEDGGRKYGDKNWLKGQPLSRYLDSALRHINNHQRGLRDEQHIIAAIWNLIAIHETTRLIEEGKLPEELNDL